MLRVEIWQILRHLHFLQVPMVSYFGHPGERSRYRSDIYRDYSHSPDKVLHPVVVTSYEVVMKDAHFLESLKFSLLILDEGHRIKNSNCRLVEYECYSFFIAVKNN